MNLTPGPKASTLGKHVVGRLSRADRFVYNPGRRRIVSGEEVVQWENGRAVVGPEEFHPEDYIMIEGERYYLDLSSLDGSDFEVKEELAVGEVVWEFRST